MSNGHILMIIGIPSSGKSTYARKFVDSGYYRLNRDKEGGSLDNLIKKMEYKYNSKGVNHFVLDNTYTTLDSRKTVLEWAHENDFNIDCRWIDIDVGDALYNASKRMIDKFGELLMPKEIKSSKDPNVYPPIVIYKYRKSFEPPSFFEGFSKVAKIKFKRRPFGNEYKNKALLLDYDGTLRTTKSGNIYPKEPNDIEIMPKRKEVLEEYQNLGYILLGISNQSGIAKGDLSSEQSEECFNKTNELLGISIDYRYCPHRPFPLQCYCRKPSPGLGVEFIENYKLNPQKCIMVGDLKTDETFAKRCGFQFREQAEFFNS